MRLGAVGAWLGQVLNQNVAVAVELELAQPALPPGDGSLRLEHHDAARAVVEQGRGNVGGGERGGRHFIEGHFGPALVAETFVADVKLVEFSWRELAGDHK